MSFLTELLLNHLDIVLVLVVVFTGAFYWLSRPNGIPPGPQLILPIIGNILSLGNNPLKAFESMRGRYGDVFSIYIGSKLVIVVCGYAAIKEMFVKQGSSFVERPFHYVMSELRQHSGIMSASGQMWKLQRKYTSTVFKELGMGRSLMEDKIKIEIELFIENLRSRGDSVFDCTEIIQWSVTNIIFDIVTGKRYSYNDPALKEYMRRMDENFKLTGATTAADFIPLLRIMPWNLYGVRKFAKNIETMEKHFLQDIVNQHKMLHEEDNISDYVDAYLEQIKMCRVENKHVAIFNERNLISCMGDLIAAATETVASTIRWALVFFLRNPDVQEKCFSEVYSVIGFSRLPYVSDRTNLPYMQATIMETQRRGNIVPINIWRSVDTEEKFRQFIIPKGVTILPNISSVLMDPKIWDSPDEFRPERFLDMKGRLIKREELIPFFVGPRSCLGEHLAHCELFLFITALIQSFQFVVPEGEPLPSLEPTSGFTAEPKPFKMIAIPRTS